MAEIRPRSSESVLFAGTLPLVTSLVCTSAPLNFSSIAESAPYFFVIGLVLVNYVEYVKLVQCIMSLHFCTLKLQKV